MIQSALKRAEMVSTPGYTLTATMLDFCTLVLGTWTRDEPSSGLGKCAVGSVSRIRW